MKKNKLRWKAGDYLRLEKAVQDFNKKVEKLSDLSYIPEKIDIAEAKSQIATRKGLQQYINQLNAFKKKGAEKLFQFESGEKVTNWEKEKIEKEIKVRASALKVDLERYETPNEQGYSLSQMGNTKAKAIKSNLKDIEKLGKTVGAEFKRIKKYLNLTGFTDFEYKKALQYKKNYMKTIEAFSNLKGYNELKREFEKHSDPKEFFEWIEKTGDDNIIDIHYESTQTMKQEQFDIYLDKLGIKTNENE